jgi:nitroreductase
MNYDNPVMENLMTRASVRRFSEREVSDELIEKIVRAGQQAPFTGQMYSVIATKNPQVREKMAELFGPLPRMGNVFMLICVDFARLERFIAAKGRTNSFDDLWMMIFGIQDAAYLGQNIVTAAESYDIGSVFLGMAPWLAPEFKDIFKLPERVWPLVGLVLGYKDEQPPARPRIPLETVLHWERYREISDEELEEALKVMDAGLIREGYYLKHNAKINLRGNPLDTVDYDQYGWGEHVSRKYSQLGAAMQERGRDIAKLLEEQGLRLNQ